MEVELICNACGGLPISNAQERNDHYRTEWHRYNVKRRCAGLGPISKGLFEEKLAELQESKQRGAQSSAQQTCALCDKTFSSPAAYRQHLQTRTHQKKEGKPTSASVSRTPSAAASDAEGPVPVPAATSGLGLPGTSPASASPNASVKAAEPAGEKKTADDEAGDEQEEELVEDKDHYAIPLGTCLFCKRSFPKRQLDKCLEHMYKQHGFFIPFPEYCTDIEGLLTYLGEKIGLGCICLYCNGRSFPSVHATQAHMEAKTHCKLRFETEEEEEELIDFFTFPDGDSKADAADEDDEEEDGKKKKAKKADGEAEAEDEDEIEGADDLTFRGFDEPEPAVASSTPRSKAIVPISAAPKRRHISGLNEAGELVMSDGSLIGHRAMWQVYRQNTRPVDTAFSSQIMASYRALTMTGHQEKSKKNEVPRRFQRLANLQRYRAEKQANQQKHYFDSTRGF